MDAFDKERQKSPKSCFGKGGCKCSCCQPRLDKAQARRAARRKLKKELAKQSGE